MEKKHLSMIACVDTNWGIGINNELMFKLKEDMEYFKFMTEYHTVVMGYNTMCTLPGLKPLKNRFNVVMSRYHNVPSAFKCVRSVEELFENINPYDTFVIGGERIYNLLLPYTDFIYLTVVNKAMQVNRYFPNMDRLVGDSKFDIDQRGELITAIHSPMVDGEYLKYRHIRYIRREPSVADGT